METNLQDLPDNIELPPHLEQDSDNYIDVNDCNLQEVIEASTPLDELPSVIDVNTRNNTKFSLKTYLMSCSKKPLIVFIVSLLVINPLTSNLLLNLVYNVVPLLGKMNENLYVVAIVYSLLITMFYMVTTEFFIN